MEKNIFHGRTKEDAISQAEKELNKDRKFLNVKVIEDSSNKMFFSILDQKNITIEVTVNEEVERKIQKLQEKNNRLKSISKENIEKNVDIVRDFFYNLQNVENKINYTIDIKENIIYVNLSSENTAKLIGTGGKNINSFQNYLNTMVQNRLKICTKIVVDVDGYKERRKEKIMNLAENAINSVLLSKKSLELEPMNSYDRKVIHDVVQNYPEVYSESIGNEPNRKVVINIKK